MEEDPAKGLISTIPASSSELRELGALAVWSVTSGKPGNGVDMLRDGRADTFWQSDGLQPHLINIQFQRKVELTELRIYVDYKVDESYTPNKISVRTGSSYDDLKELRLMDIEEPSGWLVFPLYPLGGPPDVLKTFFLQIAILGNHQNGRDTHLRLVQVFGPRADPLQAHQLPLSTVSSKFASYMSVR